MPDFLSTIIANVETAADAAAASSDSSQSGAMLVITTIIKVFGSLGFFIFGMRLMSDCLQKLAGEKLRSIMGRMTSNRFKGIFSGLVVTTSLQSSSATTVMVVSFVNAGLLKIREAIGVIMGANLGTTFTAWIIAWVGFSFSLSNFVLPIIGIGAVFTFSKKLDWKHFGEFLIGFAILFMSISLLKESVPNISAESMESIKGLTQYGYFSYIIFIVIGFLLTIVLQASSAAMAITMTAAVKGWISFDFAAAIVLGENVGTTTTAMFAAAAGNTNAKRAAMAHMCFNMIGVVWALALLPWFTDLVSYIVDYFEADKIAAAGGDIEKAAQVGLVYKLSLFHTMFNLINIILLVGFVSQLEKLVCFIIKGKKNEKTQTPAERLDYLSAHLAEVGEIALFEGQKEVVHLAEMSTKMFDGFTDLFQKPDTDLSEKVNELRALEEDSDKLAFALTNFFVQCTAQELSERSKETVIKNMIIIAELEDMSDCCYRLITMARKRYRKQFKYQMLQSPAFVRFCDEMDQFLLYAHRMLLLQHVTDTDINSAQKIQVMLDKTRKTIRREVILAIEESGTSARSGILFIEILGQCEKVGAHAMNILEALQNPSQMFAGQRKI